MKTIDKIWLPCIQCGNTTENKRGRRYKGPTCEPCYTKEYRKRNPAVRKASQRNFFSNNPDYKRNRRRGLDKQTRQEIDRRSALKRDFGITPEQYDALLDIQNGVCAVCKKCCATKKRLAVDHDHRTGRIRGLLCAGCNRGIGFLMDSPEHLEQGARYLRGYN